MSQQPPGRTPGEADHRDSSGHATTTGGGSVATAAATVYPTSSNDASRTVEVSATHHLSSGGFFSGSSSNDNSINANVFINSRHASTPSSSRGGISGHLLGSGLVLASTDGGLMLSADGSVMVSTEESNLVPSGSISLTLPRPDHQRATNVYVDTPFPHRPAPRRPPPSPSASSVPPSTRPHTPSFRSTSPSQSSSFQLHSSSTNLLQTHQHSSTLPSVHRSNLKRSFVNPNSPSVNSNNSNKGTCNNVSSNSGSNHNRNNKLSSSSFSFSTSKSRSVSSSSSPSRGGVIIQSQPSSLSFTKSGTKLGTRGGGLGTSKPFGSEGASETTKSGALLSGRTSVLQQSIICSSCGRCRCEACRTPRPPPSAWLCSGKCLCSAASVVDCVSCACCVKAVLYHCGGEEVSSGPRTGLTLQARPDRSLPGCWQRRCAIWACLALGAIPLPCLLCYFPLTGLRRLLERGYQRCNNHGCRCPPEEGTMSPGQSPASSRLSPSPPPPPRPPPDGRLLHLPPSAPPSPPSLVL